VESDFYVEITAEYAPKIEGLDMPDYLMKSLAEQVARKAKERIRRSQDLRGGNMQKLKPSTIRKKRKTASSPPMVTRPLWNTGTMFGAISAWRIAKGVWAAGIKPEGFPRRDLLGIIHQQEGASRLRVRRMFLGIPTQLANKLKSDVRRWYKKKVEKAYLNKKVVKITGLSGGQSTSGFSSTKGIDDWADSVGVSPL
jgi:hypothetical protein